MLKYFKGLVCFICSACLISLAAAESEADLPSEKLYQNMRFSESMWRLEPAGKYGSRGPWIPDSENFDEMFRLRKMLEERAEKGDAIAMFYVAIVESETAATHAKGSLSSTQHYAVALRLFKQAGDNGIYDGYWNVAVMYANGEGAIQSQLAALEWYFKAGLGYLKIDDRERALSALEAIQRIDKHHNLAKRLAAQLQKGAPK